MERGVVVGERESSARLVEACQRGDREAFRLLFESYQDRVYSIALYFFGGDAETAADLTQQVFLKLFSKIAQFKHDAEFTTWLYRLATNACLDEQRKRRRFVPFRDAQEMKEQEAIALKSGHGASQEDALARFEVAASVKQAVASLRPKLRITILLKYFEELSYEEIAEALNCSKGTVASRLNRGHKVLAERLGHLRGSLLRGE